MRKHLSRKRVFDEISRRLFLLKAVDVDDLRTDGFSGVSELDVILDWLDYQYGSSPNDFIAELYEFLFQCPVSVFGSRTELIACKCCGFETLEEAGGYNICKWCGWEDDGTTDPCLKVSINRGSMNDYRDKLKASNRLSLFHRWHHKEF